MKDTTNDNQKCNCDCDRNGDDISDSVSTEESDKENDLQKISKLEADVSALRDTLLRKIAESENLRKRLEREKIDAEKYASGKFAKDLLNVLDNFDMIAGNSSAIQEKISKDEALRAFLEGIVLCGKELISTLKKHGIAEIKVSEGSMFDPHYHQAMCEIEDNDREPGAIISVLQKGYVHHGRLLRPAMVSVARKP